MTKKEVPFGTKAGRASKKTATGGMNPSVQNKDSTMTTTIKLEDVFPEKTITYINKTVERTSVRMGFDAHEREDFRQNIYQMLLRKLPKYDSSRQCSLNTYLHLCIDGYVKDYITKLRRPQKIRRTLIVLDAPIHAEVSSSEGKGEELPLIDTVADPAPNAQMIADLRADVRYVLSRLDPVARRICELIMAGKARPEIYPKLGISKTRFYGMVFPQVKVLFKKHWNS